MTAPRRPPSPHLQALADFFASSESDQGLRSSFAPLADMARGGTLGGGSPDHERAYTDRRFGLGPAGSGAVTRARATRAALAPLPASTVAILFARYGGTPWADIIDRAHGTGSSHLVTRALGDLVGVALLAPRAAKGFAAASPHPSRPLDSLGGYIVLLCGKGPRSSAAKAAALAAQCRALLAAAEAAYLAAVGAAPMPAQRRRPGVPQAVEGAL